MHAPALETPRRYAAAVIDAAARRRDMILLCCIAVVAGRLWLGPLSSSLWLDETGTHWTVQNGIAGIAQRAYSPPQSLVYFYVAGTAAALGGLNEVALRLPSAAGAALGAFLLYLVGVRLIGRNGALWAVLIFVAWKEVSFSACDARPYALAVMAATGAVLMLLRWLDRSRSLDALGYALLAALTVHLHYLFAVMYIVHAVYAAFAIRRRPVSARSAAAALAATAALLLPLYRSFATLASKGGAFSYASEPGISDAIGIWAPPVVCGSILAGLLAAHLAPPRGSLAERCEGANGVLLLALWAVVPPLTLFAVSVFTPHQVFVARYMLCHVPGVALLAGMALRAIAPPDKQVIVAAALSLGVTAGFGSLRHLAFPHATEDWRQASLYASGMVRGSPMPVLFHSGFVLPVHDVLHGDGLAVSRYLSPLSPYPIPGEIIPLPYDSSLKAAAYLRSITAAKLNTSQRFLLISRGAAVTECIEGRLPAAFERKRLKRFGSVSVLLFER